MPRVRASFSHCRCHQADGGRDDRVEGTGFRSEAALSDTPPAASLLDEGELPPIGGIGGRGEPSDDRAAPNSMNILPQRFPIIPLHCPSWAALFTGLSLQSRRHRTRAVAPLGLALGLGGIGSHSALAGADIQHANVTSNFESTASWVGSVVPTSVDFAVFDNGSAAGNTTMTYNNTSSLTLGGFRIVDPGAAVVFNIATGRRRLLSVGSRRRARRALTCPTPPRISRLTP